MNYACAFLVLIFLFAAAYWYVAGREFYTGPLAEAGIDAEEVGGDERVIEEDGGEREVRRRKGEKGIDD